MQTGSNERGEPMRDWLRFLGLIADELHDLFVEVQSDAELNEERNKQIAMRMMRKISDERARREIERAKEAADEG